MVDETKEVKVEKRFSSTPIGINGVIGNAVFHDNKSAAETWARNHLALNANILKVLIGSVTTIIERDHPTFKTTELSSAGHDDTY